MNMSVDQVSRYRRPGVQIDFIAQKKIPELRTGIPVFVGFGELIEQTSWNDKDKRRWCRITSWQQFEQRIKQTIKHSFLRYAVRGFFENGGECCVVVPIPAGNPVSESKLTASALAEPFRDTLNTNISPGSSSAMQGVMEDIENIDLVCIPDLMMENICHSRDSVIKVQQQVLEHCRKMGDRFAIFDAFPLGDIECQSYAHKKNLDLIKISDHRMSISGSEGALYFPWIFVQQLTISMQNEKADLSEDLVKSMAATTIRADGLAMCLVPPCGHMAGIYARTDARIGVFKAPANEIIEGALDLEVSLTYNDQAELNHIGVNCFRSSLGRGIRVWGARTLSIQKSDQYISTRRLFLTLIRWVEINMRDLVFETNDPSLWDRIKHRLQGYCYELFKNGALQGYSPAEAYFVKCDREINNVEVRELGRVVSEVGLASVAPAEFIVVRITQSASGTIAAFVF
ncbi:MAG: phage tail sheath subtilisin-like domain-containing protein [Methylococcales bacterium]|nr:phage tail sheath subtilisin-like domain-containing protein [Methylococcales bacterium]